MSSKPDRHSARTRGDGAVPASERDALEHRYVAARAQTENLVAPLSAEDCTIQSMPDCSPAKWHLAHTSWFFETFILERETPDYRHFHPEFRFLFNSYYQSVGNQYPRPQRGLISRPQLKDIFSYRQHVNARMLKLFSEPNRLTSALSEVVELGIQHEQQHQELILTDIKHLLSCNPLNPAYSQSSSPASAEIPRLRWFEQQGGICWIGQNDDSGFSFDNERPQHQVFVHPFEIASRVVTNGDYLNFISDDGYRRSELWLSDGWNTVQTRQWEAPLYWQRQDGAWNEFTLAGCGPLRLAEPVCHLSYYEADAYARWAEARLPTEAEWECIAATVPIEGNFVESGLLHPSPARPQNHSLSQMYGDVWEWTASAYAAYPGYRPLSGSLGEYNGKFMSNQMVLRGGSCVTPNSHIRATYRNFFPPDARWQFSGVRLARDGR